MSNAAAITCIALAFDFLDFMATSSVPEMGVATIGSSYCKLM